MTPTAHTWIVPPRSSPTVGAVLIVVGAVLVGSSAWDLVLAPPAQGLASHVLRVGFPLLFGALLILTGAMVRATKGGLSVDAREKTVSLHGRSFDDRLALPVADLVRARLTWRDVPSGDDDLGRRWAVELETRRGATLLLGEGPQRDDLLNLLRNIEAQLPVAIDEAVEPAGPGPLPSLTPRLPAAVVTTPIPDGLRYIFKVSGPWALSGILTLLGSLSLLVGVLLMAHVTTNPISGFLFGPVLAVLGAAFLLVSLTKALAVEEIDLTTTTAAHRFRMLGRPFAERRLQRGEPGRAYARLRPRGAQGLSLEVVAQGGSLLAASGVTARSRGLDLSALLTLASVLTVALAPPSTDPAQP